MTEVECTLRRDWHELVHAHLYPRAGPAAGFVNAIATLRDQSFEALRSYRFRYL
jgi:hypothetical protein